MSRRAARQASVTTQPNRRVSLDMRGRQVYVPITAMASAPVCKGADDVMLVRGEYIKDGPYEAFVGQVVAHIFAANLVTPSQLRAGLIRIGPGDI